MISSRSATLKRRLLSTMALYLVLLALILAGLVATPALGAAPAEILPLQGAAGDPGPAGSALADEAASLLGLTPDEAPAPGPGVTTMASIASNGTQGDEQSGWPAISADGRFVVFQSLSTNLVPGDANEARDIFVHDRQTGQTTRVSVASNGTQGDGDSFRATISANGRYVVFSSDATNLVPGDGNEATDVFVHDRQTSQTTRVSLASDGTEGDRKSVWSTISADGRFVVFWSDATNLVPGDTNEERDVFVRDRQAGQTSRVSVASGGTQALGASDYLMWCTISADGRYVAFDSDAANLVAEDTNGKRDVFVHDRQTGQTSRVSVASGGMQGDGDSVRPAISADGRFVAFESDATGLVPGDTNDQRDLFIYDRVTEETTRVSLAPGDAQGDQASQHAGISADGRFVAFQSEATNLVPSDTNKKSDAFVRDRQTGQTTRVSVASGGTQADAQSWDPVLSADGRFVVFESYATNLVAGDTNATYDVFVHDRLPGRASSLYLPLVQRGGPKRLAYEIQAFRAGYWYTGLTLVDMNYDGRPEILIGNRDTSLLEIWTYNTTQHQIVMLGEISFPAQIHDVKAADFDGDGDMDVAAGLRGSGLYYAGNTGSPGTAGNWSVSRIADGYSWQVLVQDFDGDGKLDIFEGEDYGPIRTFYGDGMGDFVEGTPIKDPDTNMRQPLGFNATDIDDSGSLDLIGLDGVYLRAFHNPGNRTSDWESGGMATPFGEFPDRAMRPLISPSAGDLDSNGVVDQVAIGENRPGGPIEIVVFEGDYFGGVYWWTKRVIGIIPGAGWAGHAGVADLDGDGHLDVHVGGREQFNGLRVYLGDGSGGFTLETVPLDHGVGGFNSMAVGDLNGDGATDIVTARYTSSQGDYSGFEVLFGQD